MQFSLTLFFTIHTVIKPIGCLKPSKQALENGDENFSVIFTQFVEGLVH